MARHYPSKNDLDRPDKMERVVRDIYDRIYKQSKTIPVKSGPKRIDIYTGKVIESSTTSIP